MPSSELENTLAELTEEEKEIRSKLLTGSEDQRFGFRLFGKRSAGEENLKYAPGLKNKLNEIKNQKAEINRYSGLGKQAIRK